MTNASPLTPLLTEHSPLDEHSKSVIADLFDREQRLMADLPTDDPLDPKRRRRVDFTLPEILEQPKAIAATLEHERGNIAAAARDFAAAGIRRVYLTGCGDSLACMIAVRALFEDMLGIPCEPLQALDMAYYYQRTLGPDTLIVTLSSSGTTTRTVEALMVARAKGARTLALSNTPGSVLMSEADYRLTIHAERKGWPTQASTAAIALLCQFALDIGKEMGVDAAHVQGLQRALDVVPAQIADVIRQHEDAIARIAEREAAKAFYLYAGAGPSYAAALFGAAKVKECSPDHGLSMQLEEFHHYNSVKKGDPLFLIAPEGPSVPRACDTAFEARRWGGHVYSVVTGEESRLDPWSDIVLRLPRMPEALSALVYTVPVQLFAYHVAMAKFGAAERASKT
jgi:glucosamine--fructose-6-phosphate aminotransferase (isomerizing)